MFLFGTTKEPHLKNLTQELTTQLINKKQSNPNMPIYFITDKFNIINKPYNKPFINQLEQNNINIIYTPINKNPITNYLLKKAKKRLNHRKFIIADNNNQIHTLITSANPHDQSSPNSNTAILIKEKIWQDVYNLEIKDANINNQQIQSFIDNFQEPVGGDEGIIPIKGGMGGLIGIDNAEGEGENKPIKVQYLADNGLMHSLKKELSKTNQEHTINIAMFTLSDKKTTNQLIQASKRGANINIILDTNDFFFSQQKFGIPNKPVAEKLLKESNNKINIRWYKSHGEQFHTKLITITNQTHTTILTGSTNIANNNIRLYNLQSDIKITSPNNSSITKQTNDYFNKIYNNQNRIYTTDYNIYKSTSTLKKLRYEWEQFIRLLQ